MTAVYLYDSATGVYAGTYTAQESPLEPGVLIAPVNSTPIAPPKPGVSQAAVYASGAWSLVADFVGLTYYVAGSDAPTTISALGVTPPVGYLTAAPVIPPTLAQAQASQTAVITAAAQAALAAVVASYPDLEVATWPQQYAEAQAYTASSTAATPMLSAIAAAAGSTVAAMASGVMAKVSTYQAASGAAVGRRIALTAQIAAATTVAAVQAIVW